MKYVFFLILSSISVVSIASPLQEKLRVVAMKTDEIKKNIRSGNYCINNKCNDQGGCKAGA